MRVLQHSPPIRAAAKWLLCIVPGLLGVMLMAPVASGVTTTGVCNRVITANVVALDQPFFYNRLGAVQPHGMIYALRRDVVALDGTQAAGPGNAMLRPDKRPRPIVLRMNVGDCLQVNFTNWLGGSPWPGPPEQPATRDASVHVIGMQLVNSIADDGSWVGRNSTSLVAPGGSATYTFFAEREGQHVLHSAGATAGGEGDGGQLNFGLFGAVNVEPAGAVWYRSQVTAEDIKIGAGDDPDTPEDESARTKLPAPDPNIGGLARIPDPGEEGHPIIDYEAVYPGGHPQAGLPIFNMLQGNEIVHTDLTAIIAGARTDPVPDYPLPNPLPHRNQAFREFTIIYHDEIANIQAFPEFYDDPVLAHTLQSVRDGFAINYGTGGIGSEILADRLGVGPERDCVGCKYEEFFLTSWAVGDPAIVVDIPANSCVDIDPVTLVPTPVPNCGKATKALFPDDPSNVYHSYLRDHVKMRILHGGSKEHHIHHLHAHQWLFAPDSDESAYLDSQAIGPGASFTLEMVYNGSGNRNQTVGDSIFHCHFYPHFAQGMWSLWRVHDVFEDGTRMLPDGEIDIGTPIPGLVPIPELVMPPMPSATVEIAPDPLLPNKGGQVKINGKFLREMTAADVPPGNDVNPGYPFFIPGIAGDRPPHPPLEVINNGGLQRHVIAGGLAREVHTRLDFTKEYRDLDVRYLNEDGEPVEEMAMRYHEKRFHKSFMPDGSAPAEGFITNGLPRQPGAPFADPCIDDDGNPYGFPLSYKAANIQIDAVLNKEGWHYPQTRMITLWEDVQDTFDGIRAPEPFFFRANTDDCITFVHTNLVPNVYELDDFQVRTPTDVLGQHIHLVKFDVTSSDGSANGWNYEDANFSPEEVRERIDAIRTHNGCPPPPAKTAPFLVAPTLECPVAQAHPFFGNMDPTGEFLGAQTSVQRWMADPVINVHGTDRTLRSVFTHDHLGPSTHQQAGLYSTLVVEPKNSQWRDPETGVAMHTRPDGGPTSWRADILTQNPAESYREFMFEFADFQLSYKAGSHPDLPSAGGPVPRLPYSDADFDKGGRAPGEGYDVPPLVINPPGRVEVGLPLLVERPVECPVLTQNGPVLAQGGFIPAPVTPPPPPCPEAISAADVGTMSVNYRNEPIALRVRNPVTNTQAPGLAGDLSHVFRSDVYRRDPLLNQAPENWPYGRQTATTGALTGDPFTPIMRAYEGDKMQFRVLVGATEEGHNMTIHGVKWLFEPSWKDSGYVDSQMIGISEHFEFLTEALPEVQGQKAFADRMYQLGAATDDLWNGNWGILRTYNTEQGLLGNLLPLPSNPDGAIPRPINKDLLAAASLTGGSGGSISAPLFSGNIKVEDFQDVCPVGGPEVTFNLAVVRASDVLPNGRLDYNPRTTNGGPLNDPTSILYVRTSDLGTDGKLKSSAPVEPLILRAHAGDCIVVNLENRLPVGQPAPDLDGYSTLPMIVDDFNANQIRPSTSFGLHPQLVAYDVVNSDGANVGFNTVGSKPRFRQILANDLLDPLDPFAPPLLAPLLDPNGVIIKRRRRLQTVAPGYPPITYRWYAGNIIECEGNAPAPDCVGQPDGFVIAKPVEFGAVNLMSSDRIKHSNKGAVGALVIEPAQATWTTDYKTRASGTVDPDGDPNTDNSFREFVLVFQDDLNLRFGSGATLRTATEAGAPTTVTFAAGDPIPNLADSEDAEDSAQKAFNYRTEPFWFRGGWAPDAPLTFTRNEQFGPMVSNSQVGGDPKTPIFKAEVGKPTRFRLLHPGGKARDHVFDLHGHVWQQEPWVNDSTQIGDNTKSLWEGSHMGIGPSTHFNAVLQNGAGGAFKVKGDYLYRDYASFLMDGGLWGILRVTPPPPPPPPTKKIAIQ